MGIQMGDQQGTTYVKLTKEEDAAAPAEDITPGELNQPIQVPQLNQRRCMECGQVLPEAYEPPGDENWTTGICGCFEDPDSCRTGLFCPCVLYGRNVERLRDDTPWTNACVCHAMFVEGGIALAAATALFHGIDPSTSCLIWEGLLFTWWICGMYTGLIRQSLQLKYHLKDSPCDPCIVHCYLHWCALCQEHREMRNHLSDNSNLQMTVVDPPPVQEMNSGGNRDSASTEPNQHLPASPPIDGDHNKLEIVPI